MASSSMSPHMYLSFAEVTIVSANRMMTEKASFLQRLTELLSNTTDRILLRDLQSLYDKVSELSESEFDALIIDANKGHIMFPVNYKLPSDP